MKTHESSLASLSGVIERLNILKNIHDEGILKADYVEKIKNEQQHLSKLLETQEKILEKVKS